MESVRTRTVFSFHFPLSSVRERLEVKEPRLPEAPQSSSPVLKLQCECSVLMGQVLSSAASRGYKSWEMASSEVVTGTERLLCLFGSIHAPTHPPSPHSHLLMVPAAAGVSHSLFPPGRHSSVNEGMQGALLAQRSLMADVGKAQLKAEWSAHITKSIHRWHLPQRRGCWGKRTGFGVKLGGYPVDLFPFGSDSKHHDSGIGRIVGLKTGYLWLHLCWTLTQHLALLLTVWKAWLMWVERRKLKISGLSMNFPENLLSCSIERKGVRRYQKKECLNGTRQIVLIKAY